MELTPVSEISSTAEYEEERELVGVASRASPAKRIEETKPKVVNMTKQQLEEENTELRLMCGHLGEAYHRSKQLEQEWQSFGKYTAEVLKEELASSESQSRVAKEELQRLFKENKELKEMCLFLDQSRDGSGDGTNSLTPPETVEIMLHGKIAGEMNKMQGQVPRYTGRTKHTTLKDSEAIKVGVVSERNKEMALSEMKKRLDRLETERMELIKSLSAAHTLAADHGVRRDEMTRDKLPVHLQQKLDDIMRDGKNVGKLQQEGGDDSLTVSPDVIQNAVTLLDVVRRLDATAACGFSDGVAEAEAVALRLLVNIAWQKIQESVNKN